MIQQKATAVHQIKKKVLCHIELMITKGQPAAEINPLAEKPWGQGWKKSQFTFVI